MMSTTVNERLIGLHVREQRAGTRPGREAVLRAVLIDGDSIRRAALRARVSRATAAAYERQFRAWLASVGEAVGILGERRGGGAR